MQAYVRIGNTQYVNLAAAMHVDLQKTDTGGFITAWFPGAHNAVQGPLDPEQYERAKSAMGDPSPSYVGGLK